MFLAGDAVFLCISIGNFGDTPKKSSVPRTYEQPAHDDMSTPARNSQHLHPVFTCSSHPDGILGVARIIREEVLR